LKFPIVLVGIVLGLSQQFALSYLGLRDYLLFALRTSVISANKEGIISLPGYLAIQLLGLSVGTIILPPSPSFFRRRQKALIAKDHKRRSSNATADNVDWDIAAPRQTEKTAMELCSFAIIWWSILGLVRFFKVEGPEGGISRRMVNLPYILWVAAFNTSFLLLYLVVLDMWMFSGRDSGKAAKHKKVDETSPVIQVGNPPPLLELVNRHSLMIFLLANVLTGLINVTIPTMYASDIWALIILVLYSITICGVPLFLTSIWRTTQ